MFDDVIMVMVAPAIEYYRVQGRWVWSPYGGGSRFRARKWWYRTHQAEWEGCTRAPRAYTKRGIERKAERLVAEWMRDW